MMGKLIDNFENEQLAANFWLDEFLFSDFYSPHIQEKVLAEFYDHPQLKTNVQLLAENLQILRDHLGCAVSINIAFRPLFWELKQGRTGKSQHVKAWAGDIVADDYTPEQVHEAIEHLIETGQMAAGGLGKYNSFTHYDVRGKNARWDYC